MLRTANDESTASTIELLWGQRGASSRGPKPAFTVDDVARAAVRVADGEGIAAVSMQRVAAELGYTKMSLYRYVAGKAELLAVMIEEAIGPPPDLAAVPGGWRERATAWATLMWDAWDRHPWIPDATTGARAVGPREAGWSEAAVAAFAGTPLAGPDQMNAAVLLSGHVRNTYSPAAAGSQPWTADYRLDPMLAPLIEARADQFPAVRAAAAQSQAPQSAGRGSAAHGGAAHGGAAHGGASAGAGRGGAVCGEDPGGGAARGEHPRGEDPRAFGLARILDGLDLLMRGGPAPSRSHEQLA